MKRQRSKTLSTRPRTWVAIVYLSMTAQVTDMGKAENLFLISWILIIKQNFVLAAHLANLYHPHTPTYTPADVPPR